MNTHKTFAVLILSVLSIFLNAFAFAFAIDGSRIQLSVIMFVVGNAGSLIIVAALVSKLRTGRYFGDI